MTSQAMVKLADNERYLFEAADIAYFKAGRTSDPQDWLEAGLLARQHRNALTELRLSAAPAASVSLPEIPDDDADFTPDLARKIIAKYQEMLQAAPAASPVTTEQLDKLQFGKVLHERPAASGGVRTFIGTDNKALVQRLLHGSDDHETSMLLRQEAAQALTAPPLPADGVRDDVTFPRWWVQQMCDTMFALGNVPGKAGDCIFLWREMLKDKLTALASPHEQGEG